MAAIQPERAAAGFHPVPEADQPGAERRIRSADAVVAEVEPQRAAGHVDPDVNGGRLRVLGGVRQRLRHHVVGSDLDVFRQPLAQSHVERYPDR